MSTHSFNPKTLVAIELPIDCLKFIPVERPRLTKLLTLRPIGNKASPLEPTTSVGIQKSFNIGQLAFFVALLFEFFLHLFEAVDSLDDVPIQA